MRTMIGNPRATRHGPEWLCDVESPGVFARRKTVAGVDGTQASELAILFARTMLIAAGVEEDTIRVEPLQAD